MFYRGLEHFKLKSLKKHIIKKYFDFIFIFIIFHFLGLKGLKTLVSCIIVEKSGLKKV